MSDRIDGWKAIGAYFNRDRTTAIRWANERDLPVRRMTGGKRANVYAFKEELDAWLASHSDVREEAIAPPPARPFARYALWLGLLALVLAAGTILWFRSPTPAPSPLPDDPAVARMYLEARDNWALRRPESIQRAVVLLEQITRREPDFALGHAALADAYLLTREFGALSDAEAFPKAQQAVHKALELDPSLYAAHRANGFLLYWWEHDPKRAGEAFRRAKQLAPRDAQTHFWYANILADNGDQAAAMREFDAARLIEPGSIAIQTDLAWALWSAGRRDEAVAMLEELAAKQPRFAAIHDCLAVIRLADGNLPEYLKEQEALAAIRGDSRHVARTAELRRALAEGEPQARRVMLSWALADLRANPRENHSWAVLLASLARDRATSLKLLQAAQARRETWGDAGYVLRMRLAWQDDPQLSALIAARKAAPIE